MFLAVLILQFLGQDRLLDVSECLHHPSPRRPRVCRQPQVHGGQETRAGLAVLLLDLSQLRVLDL